MAHAATTVELLGRERELGEAQRQLDRLADGPAAVVIAGAAGIGKSALWESLTSRVMEGGARLLVTRPVEAELPMGYVGLGDLLGGIASEVLGDLPQVQASALSAALSLDAAPEGGNSLLVGRATVTALRILATERPTIVAIDDVQWLDPSSVRALAFAVRRLEGSRVGFALTVREAYPDPLGLADALGDRTSVIHLDGLSLGAIGRLVRSRIDPGIPRHLLLRIHERSAGNPFFAMQLARAGQGRLPSSLEELVRQRLDVVPAAARTAIELVAVLGPLPPSAFDDHAGLDAAVAAGILVEDGEHVRFDHPLIAAGAYERIPPARRRALHRRAADLAGAAEERAQHLALATPGPDPTTAQALEDAARAASLRGAVETAVDLAKHATRLTPAGDRVARARRTMDQADYLFRAADERGARAIVDEILETDTRGTIRTRALVHRALTSTDAQSAVVALEAAAREPHDDVRLRTRTLAQLAWQRGAWLGDVEPASAEALAALEMAEGVGDEPTLVTALTTAGLVLSLAGDPHAAGHFRRALDIIDRVPAAVGDHTPRLAFANERWWRGDFAAAESLLADERRLAEAHGDEGLLMRLDIFAAEFALRRGLWDEAAGLLERGLAGAQDYWRMTALIKRTILQGRRGEPGALLDAAELRASPVASSDPIFAAAGDFGFGLIANAEGRIAEAAGAMLVLPELSDRSGSRGPEYAILIPETVAVLVEAGLVGDAEVLTRHLERRRLQLEPWGVAAVSLCRGLLAMADGDAERALSLLEAAVDGFDRIAAPWELGHAYLATGMASRRAGKRRRAADALVRAETIFAALRAEPARRKAAEELTRARPRPRQDDRLTAAEARVAGLVVEGLTNREVAARLFTTIATVEAHLTRIYAKLGLRSRTDLARRVSDGSLRL